MIDKKKVIKFFELKLFIFVYIFEFTTKVKPTITKIKPIQ